MLWRRAILGSVLQLLVLAALCTRAEENGAQSDSAGAPAERSGGGQSASEATPSDEMWIEIPLDQVWAHRMPGTKDVLELEPEVYGEPGRKVSSEESSRRLHNSLIHKIRQALQNSPLEHLHKLSLNHDFIGFAVESTDEDALKEVHHVLATGGLPQSAFPKNGISLCFYSRQMGTYVHLTSIRQSGNHFEVHFHFMPHFTSDMSEHFALIPVEGLRPGRVSVKVIQDVNEENPRVWKAPALNKEWEKKFVSGDFEFTVE